MKVEELREILDDFDDYDDVVIVDYNMNFPFNEIYREIQEVKNKNGVCVLEKGDFY